MTDDQARRERVAAAIKTELFDRQVWTVLGQALTPGAIDKAADAAIAAYNEPEPEPQLLEDMARAMYELLAAERTWNIFHQARAALKVVLQHLTKDLGAEYGAGTSAFILGIPESMVRELLDGE